MDDETSTEFDRRLEGLLARAEVLRFDASDLMYTPVGTGTFLEAVLFYIGTSQLEDALELAQSGYDF